MNFLNPFTYGGRKPWGQQGYAHILLWTSRDLLLSNSTLIAEFKHGLVDIVASYCHVNVIRDFYCDLLCLYNLDQFHLINYTTMFHYRNLSILLIATVPVGTWLTLMPVADPGHVVQHAQYSAPGLSKHDLVFVWSGSDFLNV